MILGGEAAWEFEATGKDTSAVWDLRMEMGFGEIMGGDDFPLSCCQRSRTVGLRTGSDRFEFCDGLLGTLEAASSWLLARTILCTNPRPCSRLILGVGSLDGGGLRNAGDATFDGDDWTAPVFIRT